MADLAKEEGLYVLVALLVPGGKSLTRNREPIGWSPVEFPARPSSEVAERLG
jgi:hypothetical protein